MNIQSTPEELLKAYHQQGDRAALARLIELYNRDVFHYLISLSDQDLAQDVLQITWLKVMNTKVLKDYQLIKSWLFRIARNALFDELRKREKLPTVAFNNDDLATTPLVLEYEKANQMARFEQALSQLNFYQREAIIFQQEGFSVAEIAELTNESFETVKSRLRYGKDRLKQLLGENK